MFKFKYNGKEYDNVWFTSDEHYGSDRHILLSGRLDFDSHFRKEKYMRELPRSLRFLTEYSVYGATGGTIRIDNPVINYDRFKKTMSDKPLYGTMISNIPDIDMMCMKFISNHNDHVSENDIVFHVGDFGYYSYAEFLEGDHVLVMGNYEYKECAETFDNNFEKFRECIISEYNFIDVIKDYTIDTTEWLWSGFGNISGIYITHEPKNCIYNKADNKYITHDNGIIMNLFGHIHEKCKVKRYGLNVGVDCNHYYPVSRDQVLFYFNAILNHYDENVFE